MKKVLFIVPYPVGVAASQRFRFEQYFDVLKAHNYTWKVAPFWSSRGWSILYQPNRTVEKAGAMFSAFFRRFVLMFDIPKYSVIFIHREALPIGPPVLEYVISKIFNKKIIYDFDDAIWLENTSEQNSIAGRLKYHRKVKNICAWSWKVSCGNHFLVNFAGRYNGRVSINPTTIDVQYHQPVSRVDPGRTVVIGWTGTHSTTKYLDPLIPVFKKLINENDVQILIISNERPDWDFKDYYFVKWDKENEIRQLNQIDIGIMPLAKTPWEEGKCGFKALQYMALQKPAVVSDVGVNRHIVDHGINGFLCKTTADWKNYLSRLILSDSLRKSLGRHGREKVIRSYSVQSNTNRFLALFE